MKEYLGNKWELSPRFSSKRTHFSCRNSFKMLGGYMLKGHASFRELDYQALNRQRAIQLATAVDFESYYVQQRTKPINSSVLGMNRSSDSSDANINWSERWEYLKKLPHKLIRDLGMVIASPSILTDSNELPLVSPDFLGGDSNSWPESASWLSSLDIDHVKEWFESRSNNGRLGEHFALCIQYILLFSPVARVSNLCTSQQVKHKAVLSQRELYYTEKQQQQLLVKVDEESMNKEVLIKWGSDYEGCLHEDTQPVTNLTEADVCRGVENLETQVQEGVSNCEEFHGENLNEANVSKCKTQKLGKRKTKLLKKMERLKYGRGPMLTIGEFDFLFKEVSDKSCEVATSIYGGLDETKIKHWEVSVKFLLYAGPWEMFEIETPSYAAWKHADNGTLKHDFDANNASCNSDFFLGFFLGPHVGETLYDRKTRLMRQLLLSQNVHAASMLCKLFTTGRTESSDLNTSADVCSESQQIKALRVSPQALLKGYLFYEYELWCHLYRRGQINHSVKLYKSDIDSSSNAKVSPYHWNGWWACISKFQRFVQLPVHAKSKWCIVHKLEWLSPLIISEEEIWRKRVLAADELVEVAAKVEEEAKKMQMPRKRRFMVSEMSWEPSVAGSEVFKDGHGSWAEVSRGFIVEDTWPDSREYAPHGYRLSLTANSCN